MRHDLLAGGRSEALTSRLGRGLAEESVRRNRAWFAVVPTALERNPLTLNRRFGSVVLLQNPNLS